jgi:hypothetical protein
MKLLSLHYPFCYQTFILFNLGGTKEHGQFFPGISNLL